MKIPNKFQFHNPRKSLLIVTGKQTARFYMADEQSINEIGSFSVEKPKYTDREGRFEGRTKNGMYGSGSVYENKKKRILDEFFNKMHDQLDVLKSSDFENIYMFVPDYLKRQIKDHLPKSLQQKLKYAFVGNYTQEHPVRLVKMISDEEEETRTEKKVEPIKPEAQKIYKRAGKTKGVLRKRIY
jgi:hypothetical protein